MAYKFRGGIHPHDNKKATNKKAIEVIKPPEYVYLPVSMHIGAPCTPCVEVEQTVMVGQQVATSEAFVSAPIHAPISGVVTAIGQKLDASGKMIETITIKNDFKDTPINVDLVDYRELSSEEIIEKIRQGGIVGHGGAAFPTHVKMTSALGKIDTIVINGAECEPYITSDNRVMLEYSDEFIKGCKILAYIFGIPSILIGVEKNKPEVFPVLRQAISENVSTAKVVPLKTRFPQGAEKQLIYALTKRQVPSGKLPADVGCVVLNVDTVVAIYNLFNTGMPDIRRIVTVSGHAVANPKNLLTPIGTPISHLFECAGGLKEEPNKIIMGGPMMGVSQFSDAVPIFKGTNAILAFTEEDAKIEKTTECLRCGKCVNVCPMGLQPVYMNLYGERDMFDEFANIGGNDCIACGSCAFECPARINLVANFRTTRQKAHEAKAN